MIERKFFKKFFIYFLSIIISLFLWTIVARFINAPLILPSINMVFDEIIKLFKIKIFWVNFSYTLIRVLISFFISLVLGIFLGILSGTFNNFETFIELPMAFIRSTPVVAIILITLFWFNSSTVPIIVSILMCLPIVVTAVTEGFKKNNKNLLFMAKVYKLSPFQKFYYIKLNELMPFIINAALSVFGLSWKVVVAGEVLSLPKFGFGSLMQTAQVHLESATIIAITLILVVFSFTLEKIFSLIIRKIKKGIKNG